MNNRKDLSHLPNPYDFSHPVKDPDVFSGRESLIDEVRYYLVACHR